MTQKRPAGALASVLLALFLLSAPALAGFGDHALAADEVCNGLDDDEDGQVDEDAIDASTWYPDADGDAYGDAAATGVVACSAPTAHVADHSDSDDTDPNVNPGAPEVCDPNDVDEDSDGLPDDQDPGAVVGEILWYADGDGDGYGAGTAIPLCDGGPGLVENDTDPDDNDPDITPSSNLPPVFQSELAKTVNEGQLLTFTVAATDYNSDALTYRVTGLPGGNVVPSTGVFTWRPGSTDAGLHTATFTVTDGSLTDTLEVEIMVVNIPGTKTTLVVTKTRRKVKAAGTVSPAHQAIAMTVKLYRLRGGRWALVATKRPTLTPNSTYTTSFDRPRAGRYKVTSIFPGDPDSSISSATKLFQLG